MTAPDLAGYELVRTAPQPHGLVAHMYRRAPKPLPVDPWAEPPPWQQDELPADLEWVAGRSQTLSPEARARLAELTAEQRACLGYPDEAS